MSTPIDFAKVVAADALRGEDEEDTALLRAMLEQAEHYLQSFSWCGGISERYFGLGVGGIVAVFLFRIAPAREGVDEWLWVVVGDLPPAYLVCEDAPNPACALDAYIGEMQKWVRAVQAGESVDDLIPANVPPTAEYARMLQSRLDFLDREILAPYAAHLW